LKTDEREKLHKYLSLFGLKENYSQNELKSAYYTLAKLNHPDIMKSNTSKMRMVIINAGYHYLSKHVKEEKIAFSNVVEKKESPDIHYNLYKEAFEIMRMAFEAYFGENGKIGHNNLEKLQKSLRDSKNIFAKIINDKNYNQWVDDSIDKVASINKWL
jgi:DnaJ-class molecular chaperone